MAVRQALAAATLCLSGPVTAYDWHDAARETGLSAQRIYAIALTETVRGAGADRRPWPWTLNVAGDPQRFPDRESAEQALDRILASGRTNVDIGLMQVNWRWNGYLVDRPGDLLDPQVSLWAAARVLRACRQHVGATVAAIVACYHAGPKRSRRGRQYAARVDNAAVQLISETNHAD